MDAAVRDTADRPAELAALGQRELRVLPLSADRALVLFVVWEARARFGGISR